MMLKSSTISLFLLLAGCANGDTSRQETAVTQPFGSAIEAGNHFNEAYSSLKNEYNTLHLHRVTAYAESDADKRHEALVKSDAECRDFEHRLRECDSAWHATATWYLMLGDGSFTDLCNTRDIDSVELVDKLR